jgi:hypothetical protein
MLLTVLATPCLLIVALLFFPAPFIGKMRLLRRNSKQAAETLFDMAATIDYLASAGLFKSEAELPVFFASYRHISIFMQLLRFARLTPPMRIERVGDLGKARAVLKRLDASGWSGLLVMPSELFSRFHSTIGPAAAAQRRIVI